MRFGALVFLLLAGVVPAAARPYAPTQDFCVRAPAQPAIFVRGGLSVACFSATAECLQLGEDADDRKTVLHPPVEAATGVAHVQELDGGGFGACIGETCKKLGKRATIAVARPGGAKSDLGERDMAVTADLATIVVRKGGALELWNVAKDRSAPARGPAKTTLVGFEVVGAAVVTAWSNGKSVVTDVATGRARGAAFPSGHAVALGDARIAVVPEGGEGKISVVDVKTGKMLGSVELAAKVAASAVARAGDAALAVLWSEDGKTFREARVQVPAQGPPVLGTSQTIEACKL